MASGTALNDVVGVGVPAAAGEFTNPLPTTMPTARPTASVKTIVTILLIAVLHASKR
jgi:hypothetical protein